MRIAHSSRGTYSSQDGRFLHIGLGVSGLVDSLVMTVRWPNRRTEEFELSAGDFNRFYDLDYASGLQSFGVSQ